MSLAAVKDFVMKIRTDQALRDELEPKMKLPEEQRLSLAVTRGAQLGFDFTREEMRDADQYREFFEHVLADEKMRSELKAVTAQPPMKVVADTVKLARNHGFEFSEETMAALSGMPMDAEGELTDENLEEVSGGGKWLLCTAPKTPRAPGGCCGTEPTSSSCW